jgi:hypothetical protein
MRAPRKLVLRSRPEATLNVPRISRAKRDLADFTVATEDRKAVVRMRQHTSGAVVLEALRTARLALDAWLCVAAELDELLVTTPPAEYKAVRAILSRLRAALEEGTMNG